MNKSTLYCIACVVWLVGSASHSLAFTVSISNYSCVYSGWEEAYFSGGYYYWSGTATDRIVQCGYSNWGTNRSNTLTCQCNDNSGAVITNSGSVV
jgi:hypothetical protein